ncbi:MAG: metallophosphoesterase [Polaromonas sp.]|nr:metallophosphoesterase [Polaromonas sp.]MDP3750337.1 metallophosphoesterase [Polaromonas sp.]
MEQIFFCGDNHGRFDHLIEAVYEHAPAALVLLGDIQAQRPLEEELADILDSTEVWFIHGNHDTDSEADYDNLFGSKLAHRNLHGRVVTIAGIRIGGLGGIFRGQVWKPPEPPKSESAKEYTRTVGRSGRWRDGLPLRHRSTIFPDVYAALAKQRADVLVTHEAPSAHHHGFQALDELARSLQVRASFHGHHHVNMDYRRHCDQLGHQAFSVGFCGITALDGTVIRPGD